MTLSLLQKQLFTSPSQNCYPENFFKSHRKITMMEFFFNKFSGCKLTKKGLHTVSFRWILLDFSSQLFPKTFAGEYFCSLRFYQCSERTHSISPTKFWQLPFFDSSTTTIIIWLTKTNTDKILICSSSELWNSCPEKRLVHISENVRGGILVW